MKSVLSSLFLCALGPALLAQGSQPQESTRELYMANCAACHGEKGDGKGTASLDRLARSFVDGGFSFGNTPQAVRRTIWSGIPGTPMPAWGEALSEDQITRITAYVIELGPGLPPVPANTEMVVAGKPLVVRGMLPPISARAQKSTRGLLIGLPDGFSFEYRCDDLRLLGMRQGRFVNRTDWVGRGGTPLKPLGPVVLLDADGAPGPTFARIVGDKRVVLRSKLRGTRILGDEVWLQSHLYDDEGRLLCGVEERVRSQRAPFGSGYLRTWRLQVTNHSLLLEISLAAGKGGDIELEGLGSWLAAPENLALSTNEIHGSGEDLWLLPQLHLALQPGDAMEFSACHLRLTLEALSKIGEAR